MSSKSIFILIFVRFCKFFQTYKCFKKNIIQKLFKNIAFKVEFIFINNMFIILKPLQVLQ